jgi:hypothetical protein
MPNMDNVVRESRVLPRPKSVQDFVGRYRRVVAKIAVAGRLGSVEEAAVILRDAVEHRKNYSDWVLREYKGDAMKAVRRSLSSTQ